MFDTPANKPCAFVLLFIELFPRTQVGTNGPGSLKRVIKLRNLICAK